MESTTQKTALITGITGQVGSYLAELLLSKQYIVHGLIRRSSTSNTSNIDHILHKIILHEGDLTDNGRMADLIKQIQPNELYNLGCQSHVKTSFDNPMYTSATIVGGTVNVLEAVRHHSPHTKVYLAGSSEIMGNAMPPQNELTTFDPRSPYSASKLMGLQLGRNYRDAYNLFITNGILFNCESPRRGSLFVTRKITKGVASICYKKQEFLTLGNLDAKRDWGFAGDYVEGMWRMLQHDTPDDFVLATGESHTIREFLHQAFCYVDLNDWEQFVKIDPALYRPTEVNHLCGDASKAKRLLGWEPRVRFHELVNMMMRSDMELIRRVL